MPDTPDAIVNGTWTRPIERCKSVPAASDVVIIGGGIVGLSAAWFLRQHGVSVTVCEKGHVAGEQSGRNWGWVRIQGRDPREVPMMIESMRIWRGLHRDINADVGYNEGGCLFTARREKDMAGFEEWCDVAKQHELPTRLLNTAELVDMLGDAGRQWVGAMYTPTDGRAEPHLAAPAIARAVAASGGTILKGCAVRGLIRAAGRVAGVVTEAGEIRASTVLCAGGAWSSLFCRSLGIDLPQLKVRGTVARLAPAESRLQGNLFDDKVGIRRRQDGGYTVAHGSVLDHALTPSTIRHAWKFLPALKKEFKVLRLRIGRAFLDEWRTPKAWSLDSESPFEQQRVLNPEPNPAVLKELLDNVAETFPELAGTPVVESWAGMVETTPDVVPVIGAEAELPGFFVATGFSGHGFGLGPGAGKTIAAMLTGDTPPVDLSPFRRSRFYDGSPIVPYSEI